jgi:hypothetical protein
MSEVLMILPASDATGTLQDQPGCNGAAIRFIDLLLQRIPYLIINLIKRGADPALST